MKSLELNDEIRINAPRERVFAALHDVEILRQAIPGCEAMEASGDNDYVATVTSKIGPLQATFKGSVTISNIKAPKSCTLTGAGKSSPAGRTKLSSVVTVTEDGDVTIIGYQVQADFGGALAQLGGTIVEKTSRKLAIEPLRKFEALLNEDENESVVAAAPTPEAPSSGALSWSIGGLISLAAVAYVAVHM